ncbi:MAG: LPS export ABC transporter permease LptG [Magnetococcales bacterium]|nr:LPS export ABC transporter permease LptG [Magnetococcales bacterium]
MPILFHYLMKLFLLGFLKIVTIFIGLFLLIDGIENIRRFSQKPYFNITDLFLLIVSRIPNFLGMLTPSMVLLTTLVVISRLTRQHEITIMRASGLSHNQILIPFLLGGLLIAGGHILLLDQIAPHTISIAQKLEDRITDRHIAPATETGDLWVRSGQQIIHARRADSLTATLHGVMIFTFDDQHHMTARLEAKSAHLNEGCWQLMEGVDYQFLPLPRITPFRQRGWDVVLDPERLTGTTPVPQQLSLRELWTLGALLEQSGQDATRHRVIFHRKLAAPFTSLAAILLAFPFALRLPRSGGTLRSILFGLLLGFAMFVIGDLATALGLGGRLPPILAAWAPLVFFTGIAGYLLLHQATPGRRK